MGAMRSCGARCSPFYDRLVCNRLKWEKALALTKKGSPYVGEVLDAAFEKAVAILVLLTPDDEARLKLEFQKPSDGVEERKLTGQARAMFSLRRGWHSDDAKTKLF
jgi:hypothetical protein